MLCSSILIPEQVGFMLKHAANSLKKLVWCAYPVFAEACPQIFSEGH